MDYFDLAHIKFSSDAQLRLRDLSLLTQREANQM